MLKLVANVKFILGGYISFTGGKDSDIIGKNLARWYEQKTNLKIDVINYSCTGVHKDGRLCGAIIYTNYTGSNFDVHVFLPKSLIRPVIKEMFDYPFNRAKVKRLTARISEKNKKIEKLLIKLGFVKEATLENYYDTNEVQLIYVAKRENIEKWVS